MPFPYTFVCDLLQELDDASQKKEEKDLALIKTIIEAWFRKHRSLLDEPENDASAILSTLMPERRTDRVYSIQAPTLEGIFGKALLLGISRVQELRRYKTPRMGVDLADCIENILTRTPNIMEDSNELTVEEIDGTLGSIAAGCRFSSPAVRALRETQGPISQDRALADIYRRLSPRDAKWFTRLVLRNYLPVVLPHWIVFRCYHALLPQLMKVRDDLSVTPAFLRHLIQSPHDSAIAAMLKPALGTKVGRQPFLKGRSIKNCLDLGKSQDVSCEQKLDGEYCQIHIDLRNPLSPIQIFSKSGKDSTQDRKGLHRPIKDSLKLGTSECPIKTGCILEGELVVYSNKENKILPFHKIRKHVSRSGSWPGTFHDSQRHDHEHLMIVYFDVLMIDNESLLTVRQSQRFKRLSELITCRKGYAELVPRQVISFSRPSAASRLREAFAECIVARNEGLVLKPDAPYFDLVSGYGPYNFCNIKLKKEYFEGWGDVGDFAVVGASYDAAKAKEYKSTHIAWTHFFIGCLENKGEVQAKVEKPRFKVTNIVELSEPLIWTLMTQCFPSPVPFEMNESIVLDFGGNGLGKRPTDIFRDPLVFDMRCFSFDKEPNTNFWSMRFPIVSKIHHDRSYMDTITFAELQDIATATTEMAEVEDSQEMREWIKGLEKADPRGIPIDAINQQSPSTEMGRTPTSPNEHTEHFALSECPSESPGTAQSQKRPAPDIAVSANKSRKVSNTSTPSSSTDNSTDVPHLSVKDRQPLSEVNANSIREHHRTKSPPQFSKEPSPSVSMPEYPISPIGDDDSSSAHPHTAVTDIACTQQPTGEQNCPPQLPPTENDCPHTGKKCEFSNCSILLAPCISQYAWVADNLLQDHGIKTFFVDPHVWSQAPMPKGSAYKWDASSQKMRRLRVRKICLVESRREDATQSFVEKIEAAGLKKKNGEREWVGVYDWRILEEISDIESGKKQSGEVDPWRKHYVGIT